jgi:hypothetical protein
MNIAYYPPDKTWLKNQMFDSESIHNANDVFYRYIALKNFLALKGINLNTYDTYDDFKKIDLWIMAEPYPRLFKFILQNRINSQKAILLMIEPPVGNPFGWKFFPYYSWLFKVILTWNPVLIKTARKFVRWYFPVQIEPEKYAHYQSNPKKNLCLIMHSNRASKQPGELYSFRREIIRYFERRTDRLLDVYGYGWNDSHSPQPFFTDLYQGTVADKWETFSQYYFTFCIDNSILPGYITYDPFISMATGTVPIYWPMPDASQYIPDDTYINYNDFKSLDELTAYLQSIVGTQKYEDYRSLDHSLSIDSVKMFIGRFN